MRTVITPAKRQLAVFTVFLLCCLLSYSYYLYQRTYQTTLANIDAVLLNAAVSTDLILGDEYHNLLDPDSPSAQMRFRHKTKVLNELAKGLELEYVYAMMQEKNKVYFTASSYQADDVRNNAVTDFYDFYPAATELNKQAFYSTEPVFEESEDKWGHFRSVFVPHISKDGKIYLTGADISLARLNEKLEQSLLESASATVFLLGIALVIGVFGYLMLKRQRLYDASSGRPNHNAMAKFINKRAQLHGQLALIRLDEFDTLCSYYGITQADKAANLLLSRLSSALGSSTPLFRITSDTLALLSAAEKFDDTQLNLLMQVLEKPLYAQDDFMKARAYGVLASGHKAMLLESAQRALPFARLENSPLLSCEEIERRLKHRFDEDSAQADLVDEALKSHRLIPCFSPVVCQKSKRLLHASCSARLITEKGQAFDANAFGQLIKRCRWDGLQTKELMKKVLNRFRETNIRWSFPLDADDIKDPSLLTFLEQHLIRYPSPGNITLDLYGADGLETLPIARHFINRMKHKGVHVMLADVKLGASLTENVRRLGVSGVRLAPELANTDKPDKHLRKEVKFVVAFCAEHGIKLIATGVDNPESFNRIDAMGITIMQGKYIGPCEPHIFQQNEESNASLEA